MSKKRILIIGFVVALLIAIPATLYALSLQTKGGTIKATPATTLSFSTLSQPVATGQNFSLDVIMTPGSNQVSFVKLYITYDNTKMHRATQGIVPNGTAFPTTLEGPVYDQCNANLCTESVTLSVGADPTKVITQTTTVATLNFQAIAATAQPASVIFGTQSQVLSIASSDQPSENVLSTTNPAAVTIVDAASLTGSPTPTTAPTAGQASDTPTPTQAAGGTGSNNQPPVCSSLTVDTATGSAPLTNTFTAQGSDSDGTISKVTYNFGDGAVQDVTTGGGIGTNSVNSQISHTYNGGGTFTASAIMTDNSSSISSAGACTQVITVSGQAATPSATTTPEISSAPTIPPTGPSAALLGIGIAGIVLSVAGAFLFFGL